MDARSDAAEAGGKPKARRGGDRQAEEARRWRWPRFLGIDRLIGLALLSAFVALRLWDPYPVEFFRLKTFDVYQKLQPRDIPPPEQKLVTVIDIDEASLAELGQWPWDRATIAQMIANLANMGALLTAFDMVFAEPDRMNPDSVARTLPTLDEETRAKIAEQPSNDRIMADVMEQTRVIVGYAGYDRNLTDEARDPIHKSWASRWVDPIVREPQDMTWLLPAYPGLVRNIAVLEKTAIGHGVFSLTDERDNVVRRVPTIYRFGDNLMNSLSVEMMRVAVNRPTVMMFVDSGGIKEVRIAPGLTLPTDPRGMVWPYYSRHDSAKYVSARDVLAGTVDPAMIRGKMCIVGTSAVGLKDIREIPTERQVPGVEVHAQIIESALLQQFLQRPSMMLSVELSVLIAGGLVMVVLVPIVGARWTLGLFVLIAGGAAAASWYLFSEHLILFDAAYGLVVVLLLYTAQTYLGYAREEAQRRQVRAAFSHYLSPDMVARLAENPDQLKLGGETRDLTVMFSDIRGFTSLSEKFDAQGLTILINKLLTPLTNIVLKHRGTVDKYMGDCIMAFWNAPLDDPDHAKNCIKAALEMNGSMNAINQKLRAEATEEGRTHDDLKMGIGINTGDIVVGNMGSDLRFDYSCLGDNVNLGSRLEGQSKTYRVDIVIGENTAAKVPDMPLLELDLIRVKGKAAAVRVFTCVGDEAAAQGDAFRSLKGSHEAMLGTYRSQDWAAARAHLADCQEKARDFDGLSDFYGLYEERLDQYDEAPPPADWDGVFVAASK